MNKTKILHISLICIGIVFVLLGCFHESLWFDESYSVAISENYSFNEIWEIGGNDVHPVLYYWLLRIVGTLTGNSILAFRLFSVLAVAILGIIGYTHIRKDFGEKAGLVFSLLAFFIPTNVIYAGEIRMYTWGMLFVTIMAIYAYRIYLDGSKYKNWIIFAIFSLASAYTHYYGLMAAGIINLILLSIFIVKAVKQKKWTGELTKFIIQAIIQIVLYLPWIVSLFLQMKQVESGFWIQKKAFFDMAFDIFLFQFTGNLDANEYISNNIGIFYGMAVIGTITYILGKNRAKIKEVINIPIIASIIYILVIIGATVVSEKMNRSILYPRYMLITTGFLLIAISYIFGKYGSKKTILFFTIITVAIATMINYNIITTNYDLSNIEPIQYLKENMQEGDIFVFGNEGSGFIIATIFPQYDSYFYDAQGWNTEAAYRAFGKNFHTVYNLDFLENYKGRIWFINTTHYSLTEDALKKYNDISVLQKQKYEIKYKGYQYTFSLVQKGE